jgi:hypothetical protein
MIRLLTLILLNILPFSGAGANNNDPITINVEVRQIVVGYGSTQIQAYQNARSKIPNNFRESSFRFSKNGSSYVCVLTCIKNN